MANDISLLNETISTAQTYPGPNRTIAGSKAVLSATDVEVHGNQADVPAQFKIIELIGYLDISAISAGDYTNSVFHKANIGSCYKELEVTAGVVDGCEMYIKSAETGAKADWLKITKA